MSLAKTKYLSNSNSLSLPRRRRLHSFDGLEDDGQPPVAQIATGNSSKAQQKTRIQVNNNHFWLLSPFNRIILVVIILLTINGEFNGILFSKNDGTIPNSDHSQQQQQHHQLDQQEQEMLAFDRENNLHFCRVPVLRSSSGIQSHASGMDGVSDHEVPIGYQCQGTGYLKFAKRMRYYVHQQQLLLLRQQTNMTTGSPPVQQWGQLSNILPKNTNVLVVGNSHIRQIALTWACQYAPTISRVERWGPAVVVSSERGVMTTDPNTVTKIQFENRATLWIVADAKLAYSPHWDQLLDQTLQGPQTVPMTHTPNISIATTMDAVILGVFNACIDLQPNKYPFQDDKAQESTDVNPTNEMDCQNFHAPTAADVWTRHKNKPLLFVSPFSVAHLQEMKQARRYVRLLGLPHVAYRKGRKHIETMNSECGAVHRLDLNIEANASSCIEGFKAWGMHRCTGAWGGHADLVAWDVADFVWKHVAKEG